MTIVEWAKKNSRAMGKLALYGTGGVLIGAPVIKFASNLWKGQGIEPAVQDAVFTGFGVDPYSGYINNTNMRNGAIRTALGAVAILAAKKI